MSVKVSSDLKSLIKDFIRSTLDNRTPPDKIYEMVPKIYTNTQKDAEDHVRNRDYKEASRVYILASKALKEGTLQIIDKEVYRTLVDAALAWQRQAEQTLYDGVTYYANKAYEYEKQGAYEKSTEWKNKANALEYQIKIGFPENLYEEVSNTYKSIYDDAYHEFRQRPLQQTTEIFKTTISNIDHFFRRKLEGTPEPIKEPSPLAEPHITPEQIAIKNDYEPSKIKDGYYDWWVYLIAENNVMKQIESVTYTLHPTFPEPVVSVKDPKEGFRLNARGWGEFQIKVDIHLRNGETISKYHWLDFGR